MFDMQLAETVWKPGTCPELDSAYESTWEDGNDPYVPERRWAAYLRKESPQIVLSMRYREADEDFPTLESYLDRRTPSSLLDHLFVGLSEPGTGNTAPDGARPRLYAGSHRRRTSVRLRRHLALAVSVRADGPALRGPAVRRHRIAASDQSEASRNAGADQGDDVSIGAELPGRGGGAAALRGCGAGAMGSRSIPLENRFLRRDDLPVSL